MRIYMQLSDSRPRILTDQYLTSSMMPDEWLLPKIRKTSLHSRSERMSQLSAMKSFWMT